MESSRRSQQTLPREVREAVSSGHLLAACAGYCGWGGGCSESPKTGLRRTGKGLDVGQLCFEAHFYSLLGLLGVYPKGIGYRGCRVESRH